MADAYTPEAESSLPDSGKEAAVDPDLGLFPKLKQWVRDSLDQHGDWYKEAKECYAYEAGRGVDGSKGQWGDSWREMLDSGRQPIELNWIAPMIDIICGLEINNRQETKYRPRTQGDVEADERLSSLGDWARDETNAEDEESDAFRNTAICGRGVTETRVDFDEEPTGKIIEESLDPLECGVDPGSKKPCFSNRRYSWRFRDLPTDEARALFEGVDPVALNANWAASIGTTDGGEGNKTDYPDETRAGLQDTRAPKSVRVVYIEWWEPVTRYLIAAEGADEPQEISAAAYTVLQEQMQGLPPEQQPRAQKIKRRRYRQAFLGKNAILELSDIPCFRMQWMTGKLDRNAGYHHGWVRAMRDPQMLGNKTLAQVLHILNTNAKGGLLIEKGAFANPRDAEKDWANPAKSILLNEGGIAKIKDRTPPPMPPALVQLQEFALHAMRDVTGINIEMMGLADRDQPASLEYQRRQSAITILASLFNSLRNYRKNQGETMMEALKLLPPGVLVRVLIDPEVAAAQYGQAMAQWNLAAQQAQSQGQAPPPQPEPPGAEFLSNTKTTEKFDPNKFGLGPDSRFDVIVDETPSSPNQKEATWAALQPFMDKLPPQAIKIALQYSPLPVTAAEQLGDAIVQAGAPQIPPEIQQLVEQGKQRIAELEQENAQLKDKAQIEAGKLGVQQYDADTRRLKVDSDERIAAMENHIALLATAVSALTKGQANGQGMEA